MLKSSVRPSTEDQLHGRHVSLFGLIQPQSSGRELLHKLLNFLQFYKDCTCIPRSVLPSLHMQLLASKSL